MRAGVVSLATVAKYGRMDAAFFLYNAKEDIEKIKRTRKRLQDAKRQLKAARAKAHANRNRHRAMVARGEVRMLAK